MKQNVRLMLDSGAYTAFNKKGVGIDLDAYCRFVERNRRSLWQYVNLDDIGHDARSAEQSAKNQAIMKARGLTPIPVFHCGEPLEWLQKMIDDDEKYIALSLSSVRALMQDAEREIALVDQALDVLDAHHDIKLHLMGFMAWQLLQPRREFWYSADSTSWSKQAYYGNIRAPFFDEEKGEYNYFDEQIGMNVNDYDKSPMQTEMVARWLTDHGFGRSGRPDLALIRVKEMLHVREGAMLLYYQRLCAANGIIPVFATIDQADLSKVMNEMKAEYRLLSFYKIRKWNQFEVGQYVNYGQPPMSKKQKRLRLLDRAAGITYGGIFNADETAF